jgi:6-phospho-beta-glucosidase
VKVAVVGGGSTYTPELVDGLARLPELIAVDELVLTDPAEERLALVAGISQRILNKYGYIGQIAATSDLEQAVADAAVVLIQLRVGGQAARALDETLPLKCGCLGQETTGAGGLAKALRTVPVILDMAERISQLAAKDAWIIDFTNPVGIVTRALLDHGHRAVGLCNVAIGNQRTVAGLLGVEPSQVLLDHVGLNHLTWTRQVLVNGQDRLPDLLASSADVLSRRSGLPTELLRRLGVWPSYYLRYFYEHDHVVVQQRATLSRAEEVAEIERRLLEIYADPAVDEKPDLLRRRGGAFYSEAAVNLMASLTTDQGDVQVINMRNHGTLPFLADHAVIEIPAHIGGDGPAPGPVAAVDPLYAGLIAHVSAYEELALEAATRGGRERVFRALLAHPLIGQHDLADKLTDLLINANRDHLRWAR